MSHKHILVTGGSGLVGKAIKDIVKNDEELLTNCRWFFPTSEECNLLNREDVEILFSDIKPVYVIHLAAKVGGLYKNISSNVTMFEHNLKINTNIVECCHRFGVRYSVHCLSTCIFPDDVVYPINEEKLHLGPPHQSNKGYSYAKRMLQVQTELYNDMYKKDPPTDDPDNFTLHRSMVCVIPTNIYGPYDNFHLQDSHVIPGLIHKAYNAKRDNQPLTILGSGVAQRQFIYSYDVARLILLTLFEYAPHHTEPIILSTTPQDEVSIKDIVNTIAEMFDIEQNNIVFDTTQSDGQLRKTADNSKLLSLYPDFEFTPIKDGLETTIAWFKQNYNKARK